MGFFVPGGLASGVGGGGFFKSSLPSPTSISNLVFRVFNAAGNSYTDAGKTTNPTNGQLIRVWEDTDNSLDFTVPAGTSQPVFRSGGQGQIDFDGSNDFLTSGNTTFLDFERTQPFSIFTVLRFDALSGTAMICAKNDAVVGIARGWILFMFDNRLFFDLINDNVTNQLEARTVEIFVTATAYSLIITYPGDSVAANVTFRRNGVDLTNAPQVDNLSATTLSNANFNIGNRNDGTGSESMNGKIDELVIYDKVLSAAEIDILEEYKLREYGF